MTLNVLNEGLIRAFITIIIVQYCIVNTCIWNSFWIFSGISSVQEASFDNH